MILTYKYRLKDRGARKALRAQAWGVNQVWNYCVAYQRDIDARYRAGAPKRRWPTNYDLQKLTSGTSRDLGIHSGTINVVCRTFAESRDRTRHAPRFRASSGPRRALGWVPFRGKEVAVEGNAITLLGKRYRFFLGGRPVPEINAGCFVEDAQGRWFVCFQVEVEDKAPAPAGAVGIDLGLKALATCSDGITVSAPRHYHAYAERMATTQRSGNRRRARALHAKVRNCRRDFLHKASAKLAATHSLIAVGNVSSARLARTRMAKSVLDAGWSMFRSQLRYKASRHGAVYLEVDERFTTQACSCCGAIPDSSPKGMGALGIRAWECSDCGASHDRDVNAARNILRLALSAQRHADESRPRGQDKRDVRSSPLGTGYTRARDT